MPQILYASTMKAETLNPKATVSGAVFTRIEVQSSWQAESELVHKYHNNNNSNNSNNKQVVLIPAMLAMICNMLV